MTTPQDTFFKPDEEFKVIEEQLRPRTSHSIYCAECLCGRHFETHSREWICPDCQRHIAIEWGLQQEVKAQSYGARDSSTVKEVA